MSRLADPTSEYDLMLLCYERGSDLTQLNKKHFPFRLGQVSHDIFDFIYTNPQLQNCKTII